MNDERPMGRAVFEIEDPPTPYRGPERRKGGDRRLGNDRREMVRFEPEKQDRRSGKDRRRQSGWDTIR